MDDSVTGAQTKKDVFELYQKCKNWMKEGGFLLRKWNSNDYELRKMIFESESKLDDVEPEKKDSYNKIFSNLFSNFSKNINYKT